MNWQNLMELCMDLLKSMCREGNIPYQYELLEMTVTGLYTAQYGRCGVVIGGMDVPEENGRILLSDLCSTRALVLAAAQNADRMLEELASRPAVIFKDFQGSENLKLHFNKT